MRVRYLICLAVTMLFLAAMLTFVGQNSKNSPNNGLTIDVISPNKLTKAYEAGCEKAELTFNDEPVAFDEQTQTAYIVQSLEKESWEGFIDAKKKAKVYAIEDEAWGNKAAAIASGHVFELLIVDEKAEEYRIVNCIFTGMPVLTISVDELHAGSFAGDSDDAWTGRFTLDSAEDGHQETVASYKRRGATSYDNPKYGIRIELDEKLQLLGMREDDDWQLNALYDDWGLIHNELSYTLWNQMAATNDVPKDEAIEEEYVEVLLDGEYMGVYLLQERYDAKKAQVDEGDIIYKSWGFDYPDSIDNLWYFATQRYPNEVTDETLTPLWDWCRGFWADEQLTYEEALDVIYYENTIDYTLFCDLATGLDNSRKNIYYVARKQEDGSHRICVIPWDLNITWGVRFNEGDGPGLIYGDVSGCDPLRFSGIRGLMDMNCYQTAEDLYYRWMELRDTVFTVENMESILNERLEYLHSSGAYARNYERWPENFEYWNDNFTYEFIEERLEFLDYFYESYYNEPYTYM